MYREGFYLLIDCDWLDRWRNIIGLHNHQADEPCCHMLGQVQTGVRVYQHGFT
jgi:hypothetical protein